MTDAIERVRRQRFEVTVIFAESDESHAKNDDMGIYFGEAFGQLGVIWDYEKLEDVVLEPVQEADE